MKRIEKIISKGGPQPEDYLELREAIDSLLDLSKQEEEELKDVISPILSLDTMQGHAYHKPHGYAGDFEIIDKIYTRCISNDPELEKWDIFCHSQEAPIAVRNRKKYFIDLVSKVKESARILNIGSGPARDIKEYFDSHPKSLAKFDCVELDGKAITYASSLCKDYMEKIKFINRNIFRIKTDKKYDLIWSAGLFDYFTDKQFVRLLKRLLDCLEDDGELVIGNFSIANPSRMYMEKFGEWFLNYRSKSDLLELAMLAGAHQQCIEVYQEDTGVNLFLHIRMTNS